MLTFTERKKLHISCHLCSGVQVQVSWTYHV